VLQRFGPQVRAAGTTAETAVLDRAALARIVFADPAERRWLEALVHPLVRQRMGEELTRLAKEPVVVLMVPLLFEAGLEGLCSEVWLVECDQAQQLERLMARNGLNQDEALARINAQWPLERKRALADSVINNNEDAGRLGVAVKWTLLKTPQETKTLNN
jgi:dephospho-CoA kinase